MARKTGAERLVAVGHTTKVAKSSLTGGGLKAPWMQEELATARHNTFAHCTRAAELTTTIPAAGGLAAGGWSASLVAAARMATGGPTAFWSTNTVTTESGTARSGPELGSLTATWVAEAARLAAEGPRTNGKNQKFLQHVG